MQADGEGGLAPAEDDSTWHGLDRRRSTPLLLNFAPLDFFEGMSEGCAFNGRAITLAGVAPLHPRCPHRLMCCAVTGITLCAALQ